jgi:Ran GTPase-activating protein (RanGAP) involved in mRNA processing and transport
MLKIDTDACLVTMSQCEELSTLRKIYRKLEKNTKYTIFEVNNNYFSYRTAGKTIKKMFSENFRGAVIVDLSNNGFNSKHVGDMIALMADCEDLKELNLADNFFNRKDKMRLAKAARKHPNLTLFLDRLTRS